MDWQVLVSSSPWDLQSKFCIKKTAVNVWGFFLALGLMSGFTLCLMGWDGILLYGYLNGCISLYRYLNGGSVLDFYFMYILIFLIYYFKLFI